MLGMINCWAVLLAAVLAFVLGAFWYSPYAFGKTWMHESGVNPDSSKGSHKIIVFVVSFFLSLIAATVFAIFVGVRPSFFFAVGMGLSTGLAWVATSFGINYLFAGKSMKLLAIDAGYHTVQFTLYGIVLGLWH